MLKNKIIIYCTSEQHAKLDEMAKQWGYSLSSWALAKLIGVELPMHQTIPKRKQITREIKGA